MVCQSWGYASCNSQKTLNEKQNMAMILFDLLQLLLLLFFTGGLNNPFAVLVIAPVAISATSLPVRYTFSLGIIAIFAVTLLANYNYPLLTEQGFVLRVPNIFIFGNCINELNNTDKLFVKLIFAFDEYILIDRCSENLD